MPRIADARKRRVAFAWWAVVLAWTFAFASMAHADSRTDFLIGRLKADDFRVRTKAALALGQSDDNAAVPALCGALDDASGVVRQAAAAGLQKLAKPGGADCLRARVTVETNDAVKRAMMRALAAIGGGGGGGSGPSPVVANAKYYVSISSVANQTGRPDAEINQVVGAAIRAKLAELHGYQIAPPQESLEQARATIGRRKLTGYYLSVRVEPFDYSGGNLRVRVKVAVFTYPGKDLRGEVPAALTQTGVSAGDKSAEDNLLQMASARAAELFTQNFP
jgi:hypothetical protein